MTFTIDQERLARVTEPHVRHLRRRGAPAALRRGEGVAGTDTRRSVRVFDVPVKGAVYNEIDPFCVEWLKRLIMADMIAPGDVDDRSILDVAPDDWRGYAQVHAFAGIGVWSYALRRAGWDDSRPVWTGSCPCQPFSQAGAGLGFADERHLWPAWHWHIDQLRPDVVLGEQVASADGLAWLDLVSTDLEGSGYACGTTDQCVAGFGGPHIRQRLWFVGLRDADESARGQGRSDARGSDPRGDAESRAGPGCTSFSGRLSDLQGDGRRGREDDRDEGRRERTSGQDGAAGGPALAACGGRQRFRFEPAHGLALQDEPLSGFWSGADWLWYRDGKYRPVEAGTFPLAPSAPGRVGRLRAYGNSVNAEVCQGFVEAVMSLCP